MLISELQRELVELEADLADEARSKARLHALNARLGSVIRELEQTSRDLAGSDARVYRRVARHLHRAGEAVNDLQEASGSVPQAHGTLLGRGSCLKQSVTNRRKLCREHGIRGCSRLPKAALASILEQHGVEPPPPPLESFSRKELIALVRRLLGEG